MEKINVVIFYCIEILCEVKNVCMLFLYGMFDWKCDPYSNTVQLICSFVRLIHSLALSNFTRLLALAFAFIYMHDWYGDALRHDIKRHQHVMTSHLSCSLKDLQNIYQHMRRQSFIDSID